ncbi:MAG: FtsQ-type POTRA domain-containing protein [Mogibacterium sp.]|nr:FtsQ-type POTRA domain-containing protein [Mogibacterium sp.]
MEEEKTVRVDQPEEEQAHEEQTVSTEPQTEDAVPAEATDDEQEQSSVLEVPQNDGEPELRIRQAPPVDGIEWTGILELPPDASEDQFRYEDVYVPRDRKRTRLTPPVKKTEPVKRPEEESGTEPDGSGEVEAAAEDTAETAADSTEEKAATDKTVIFEKPEKTEDTPAEGAASEDAEPGEAAESAEGVSDGTVQYGLTDEDVADSVTDGADELKQINEKIKHRKAWKKERVRRTQVRNWSILAVVLLSIAFLILSLSNVFTVDAIEVRGNSHFTSEEIINIAHAVPGKNLIYHPDKKEIKDYLEQNPYIKHAEVKRKLPSTLVIVVEERQQACAFRYDDDYLIMDKDGILLRKTRTEPKLTMVKGLVVSRIKLGEVVGTEDPQLFKRTLEIVQNMLTSDLFFVRIEMGEDDAVKAYIYDTFLIKTTTQKLIDNLKNDHLHLVIERLFADGIRRGTLTVGDDGSISFEPGIQ